MNEYESNLRKILQIDPVMIQKETMYPGTIKTMETALFDGQSYTLNEFLPRVLKIADEKGPDTVLKFFQTMLAVESVDDSSYDNDYHTFQRLNVLCRDEMKFYQHTSYNYATVEINGKIQSLDFTYLPPSVSYTPLYVELYKLYEGNFTFQSQEKSTQLKELGLKIWERIGSLNVLELGCGPGYGLRPILKVVRSALGIDRLKFKVQPKGTTIVHDDILRMYKNKRITSKKYDLIYSGDLLSGPTLDSKNTVKDIIRVAHTLLSSRGLQVHFVPYKKGSEKIQTLIQLMHFMENEAEDLIQHKKWSYYEINRALQDKIANAPPFYTRDLLLEENDVHELSCELNTKILKHTISNGHWIFAMQKRE